jgi:hypothetical protein
MLTLLALLVQIVFSLLFLAAVVAVLGALVMGYVVPFLKSMPEAKPKSRFSRSYEPFDY